MTNDLKSTHDYALVYTAKGVSVISLKPKSKQPSIASWKPFTVSRPSEEQLESWFVNTDNNIGIITRRISSIFAIDIDGQELPLFNISNPIVPGGGLYSSASDMLKFLSANMGLIKKVDKPMQESHLILHESGLTIPNNKKVSIQNFTDSVGLYIGLRWFVTTDFGNEIIWHNGATGGGYNAFMAFNPATDRGIMILCSSAVNNADISIAGLYNNNALSTLVWNLLKG